MEDKCWLKSYSPKVKGSLEYPDLSLGDLFDQTVAKVPDNVAMIFAGQEMTYGQFGDRVNRLALALLKLGLKKGERVGLMGPNCPQWEIAYFAMLKIGVIVVQTNPMYVERELLHQMRDSEAKGMIILDALYPKLKAIQQDTAIEWVITFSFQG